jgi:hypothetical protein
MVHDPAFDPSRQLLKEFEDLRSAPPVATWSTIAAGKASMWRAVARKAAILVPPRENPV